MARATPAARFDANATLIRRFQAGDRRAGDDLVRLNHPLLLQYVKAAAPHAASLEVEDLLQEARLGLIRAAERFDLSRGLAFSTYASFWIRQSVRRAVENQDRLIRLPVCRQLKPEPDETDELTRVVLSLDYTVSEDGESLLADLLPDPGTVGWEDGVLDRLEVETLLAGLPERQRRVMTRRFLGETLADIAEKDGLTRERIRQVEQKALGSLRQKVGAG